MAETIVTYADMRTLPPCRLAFDGGELIKLVDSLKVNDAVMRSLAKLEFEGKQNPASAAIEKTVDAVFPRRID